MKLTKANPPDIRRRAELETAVVLINAAIHGNAQMVVLDRTLSEPDRRRVSIEWSGASGEQCAPHEALLRLPSSRDAVRAEPRVIWVLPRTTVREREDLRQRSVSFVDLAGRAVSLRLPCMLVDRDAVKLAARQRITVMPTRPIDPFTDTTSQVVRVLLRDALTGSEQRSWRVRELAAAAGVNRTTTSEVVRHLADINVVLVAVNGRASDIRLIDPIRLIELWSRRYEWTDNHRLTVHAPIGDHTRFIQRLPEYLDTTRWALTLHAAAALLAPHAAWDKVHLYVDVPNDAALRDLAASRGWEPGADGNLVLMRPFYRISVWHDLLTAGTVPVVGLPQLLVDLWNYPVRGREQAEHLLQLRQSLPRLEHHIQNDQRRPQP